ncbi:carboxypeptidase-like regulatory domain-containing protein [Hymenobacter bucti]|uniref:Carboxypeptidase-like regulatory domain-containing protein n=1 Tax=Hymenobacter bucti TaxID=1844114 RepID=A0ABW4R1J3_9BACT
MHLLLLLTLLLSPFLVSAQSVTVRGVVRAKVDYSALAGVTIREKGTAHGTATDVRGRFTLETTTRAPRLVVSFVGYITQELPLPKNADSVVVVLQADSRALSEVVVVGYAAPVVIRSVSGSVATVSGLAGRVAGVKVERVSRAPAAPRAAGKATAMATTPRAGAGILTAGEVNDFSKWTLWSGIAQTDLRDWRQHWQLSPQDRYAVQLVTDEGFPVVGATVLLKDRRDSLLWQAQSDNTGKCELWNNLFTAAAATEVGTLQALVAGKMYTVRRPTRFHDGLNLIRVPQPCGTPSVVDIAFVVDATSSMGDEIQYLQAELQDVIAHAKDSLASTTLNLGSVFYRDAGDEYVTRTSNLSPNVAQTLAFIGQQQAGGGGDMPEAVDQALTVALNDLTWSSQAKARLLFLILDAPPHENPLVLASLQRAIRQAAAKGIRIIPITASGIDKSTEYLMRSLALATNGTYVFLTDESGVGNAHLKPTTDKFDVELLNTLLVKLIAKYAYTADCQTTSTRPARTLAGHYQQVADTTAGAAKPRRRSKDYAWKCYPNPTPDELHVELAGEVPELFITDVTGKLVLRAVPAHHRATIQLSNVATGIYFLRFFTGHHWEQAKFLVSR